MAQQEPVGGGDGHGPPPHPRAHGGGGGSGRAGWLSQTWIDTVDAFTHLGAVKIIFGLEALVAILLLGTPQGRDLAYTIVEHRTGSFWTQSIALALITLFFGGSAWFWSRRIITQNCPHRSDWHPRRVLEWTPRLLAGGPFLIAAIAFIRSGSGLRTLAVVLSLLGFALVGLLWARVRLMDARVQARLQVAKPSLFEPQRRETFSKGFARFSWALAAVVFAWICIDPVRLPQWLGAINVVFLGVALIIPVLAAFVQWVHRYRIPVLWALLAIAVALSWSGRWFRDNHAVGRRAFGGGLDQAAAPQRDEDFKAAFDAWWKVAPDTPDHVRPMVVVAAEGGASRAGIWAAETLGRLQELSAGDFSNHVFAISSVSGGSVGAAAFVSQLDENPTPQGGFRAAVRDAAAGDYLSPVLAGLLFPDLAARFLPTIPIGGGAVLALPDRAEALEKAFESGWRGHCIRDVCRAGDEDLWTGSFMNLWRGGPRWTPRLIINGAREEDGRRVLTAPFRITPDEFPDAVDFFTVTGRDLAVSSAIHNGARFPIVSPGGTLLDRTEDARKAGVLGRPLGHVLDGGYFEGSGVVTAADVVRAAQRYADDTGRKIRPMIIELNNDSDSNPLSPEFVRGWRPPVADVALAPSATKYLLSDVLGPLLGLYQSRDGRAVPAAITASRQLVDPKAPLQGVAPPYSLIQLCNGDMRANAGSVKVPMDWALSQTAKDITEHADDPDRPENCRHNKEAYGQILAALATSGAVSGPAATAGRSTAHAAH